MLDGVDQTIFQTYTVLDLTDYQSYDKALDVYYLTVAYLSTMRNWDNITAFDVSRFLIYYRLVGVLLFETFENRTLLLIFPNTFEYFFIFYEAVRLRWNPVRMSKQTVIGAAAFIWIVIKLPQEYWIHVAQRDVTDTLRANPVLYPILGVVIVALVVCAWWLMKYRLPPADRRPSFAVDAAPVRRAARALGATRTLRQMLDATVGEKIALIALVVVIFSQIVPGTNATTLQLTIGVAFVIVSNTLISELLARRGVGEWTTVFRQFVGMAAINIGAAFAAWRILPTGDRELHLGNTLFFLLLITLMITLYDRFHPYYLDRIDAASAAARHDPAAGAPGAPGTPAFSAPTNPPRR